MKIPSKNLLCYIDSCGIRNTITKERSIFQFWLVMSSRLEARLFKSTMLTCTSRCLVSRTNQESPICAMPELIANVIISPAATSFTTPRLHVETSTNDGVLWVRGKSLRTVKGDTHESINEAIYYKHSRLHSDA